MKSPKLLPLLSAALFTSAFTTQAADITWDGETNNDYSTGTNWDTDSTPALNGTDNAFIGGTAVYTPGGDFILQGGSTLTVTNGGSWSQTGGIAWIQAQGGNLVVNSGGTFDTGTAGNMLRDAGTSITVNGTFNYNAGNFATGTGAFTVGSGGNLNVSGELNLGADFTFNNGSGFVGGSVITALTTDYILTIDGASLSVVDNGPSIAGFFGFDSINNYIDFTSSGGTITIGNVDGGETEIQNAINSGMYRYNGAIDATNITYSDLGGGTFEVVAVPEPSTFALLIGSLALGLGVAQRRKV